MTYNSKVNFSYKNKSDTSKNVVIVLSLDMLKEDKMSDEDVVLKLCEDLRRLPLSTLVSEGYILAARNLLKKYPDAHDIHITETKMHPEKNGGNQAAGGIIILAIVAFIMAVVFFPLLVMLGMRGKLFFKGFYEKCKGEAYKKFVKLYTIIGIALYVVSFTLVIVDKIFELYKLVGPAFNILLFGGITYFAISLFVVKKRFLLPEEKFELTQVFDFSKMFKKNSKDNGASPDNDADISKIESKSEYDFQPNSDGIKLDSKEESVTNSSGINDKFLKFLDLSKEVQKGNAEEDKMTDVGAPIILRNRETKQDKKKPSSTKNKGIIVILIIIIITLILIGCSVICWVLKNKQTNDANFPLNETTVSEFETNEIVDYEGGMTDLQTRKIDITDYVGHWYIEGDSFYRELTIHNNENETVYFSLKYFQTDEITNVAAKLNGNVAPFVLAYNGMTIKGELIFVEGAIIVSITDSTRVYMPPETLNFTILEMTSKFFSNDIYEDDGYLFPTHNTYLTYDILSGYTKDEINLICNEMYARHGQIFKNQDNIDYFSSQSWYHGEYTSMDYVVTLFNDYEKKNLEIIVEYRRDMGWD